MILVFSVTNTFLASARVNDTGNQDWIFQPPKSNIGEPIRGKMGLV